MEKPDMTLFVLVAFSVSKMITIASSLIFYQLDDFRKEIKKIVCRETETSSGYVILTIKIVNITMVMEPMATQPVIKTFLSGFTSGKLTVFKELPTVPNHSSISFTRVAILPL